jgi:plastocyanin
VSNLGQPRSMLRRGGWPFPRHPVRSAIRALLPLSAGVIAACSTSPIGYASGSPAAVVELAAADLAFDRASLRMPAGVVVALTLDNRDPGILHNVAVYPATGGQAVFRGDAFVGIETRSFLLGPLAPGTYHFVCDVHPTMSGTLSIAR